MSEENRTSGGSGTKKTTPTAPFSSTTTTPAAAPSSSSPSTNPIEHKSKNAGTAESHTPEKLNEVKQKTFRERIIDEVLQTEQTYANFLKIIREQYLIPLRCAHGPVLFNPEDLESITIAFEPIFLLNSALLEELSLANQDGTIYDVCGSIFQQYVPSMRVYLDYVVRHGTVVQKIKEQEDSNHEFKDFLAQVAADPVSNGLNIYSLLITPVSRVARYSLLMGELLKYTPESHQDYPFVEQASITLQDVCGYLQQGYNGSVSNKNA